MGDKSKIEWCDATWNPIRGCSRVSEGCRNCYAERVAARFSGAGQPYEGLAEMTESGPRWTGEVRLIEERLEDPLRWKKPRRIFVNSMSDLFHEKAKDEWIDQIFAVMSRCPQHTFQVLTKRPYRMARYLFGRVPLQHILLGFSAEDQPTFDERWSDACNVAAGGWNVWLSAEPLLGSIDLYSGITLSVSCANCGDGSGWIGERCSCGEGVYSEGPMLCWVVAGGESGSNARPMHPQWARKLRDDCLAAGVPFFFKQHGEHLHESQIWKEPERAEGVINSEAEEFICRVGDIDSIARQYDDRSLSYRVGKHRAGRTLDGRAWDQFPEVTRDE